MLTDEVLVDRVVAGFEGDFDELYRRHSQSAWRLAQAITGDAREAADAVAEAFARVFKALKAGRLTDGAAFREYLLTATRNASLDGMRRGGKARTAAGSDLLGAVGSDAQPGTGDAALVVEAYRNLPERWRSVLWLTEVEGTAPADVAVQLGISASSAAQLAARARAGLRERLLQAHLQGTTAPDCRFTVDRLGAHVAGGLAPRDLIKVEQHLVVCADCRRTRAELEDLGASLRHMVLPIPLVLAGMAAARVSAALAAPVVPIAATSAVTRVVTLAKNPTPRMQRLVAASAAGLFGLGVIAASFDGGSRPGFSDLASPAGASEAAAEAEVELPDATYDHAARDVATSGRSARPAASSSTGSSSSTESIAPAIVTEAPRSESAPTPAATTEQPPATDEAPAAESGQDEPAPAPATPGAPDLSEVPELPGLPELSGAPEVVDATVGATVGDESVGVTVELDADPEIGVAVGPVVIGTPPEAPEDDGAVVSVAPAGADPIVIGLP